MRWSYRPPARRIRGPVILVLLSAALLTAISAGPAMAAGGTSPTSFNTGSVTCRDDFILGSSTLRANRPVMQTFGTYFNGYFSAFSVVQFSTDGGSTWRYWSGTKRSHGLTRVYGYGASAFHNVTWGPWDISSTSKSYSVRIKTTFRWLDRFRNLLATRVRYADYYRTELYWSGNPFGQVSTDTHGCVLVLG